jgi:hypothetical protein
MEAMILTSKFFIYQTLLAILFLGAAALLVKNNYKTI